MHLTTSVYGILGSTNHINSAVRNRVGLDRSPQVSRSSAKECPTAEKSDVLNRNFDLSAIDYIQQLENPHYSCTLM